jgi:hypothetical protein
VTGFCEHGDEPSVSIKDEEFVNDFARKTLASVDPVTVVSYSNN